MVHIEIMTSTRSPRVFTARVLASIPGMVTAGLSPAEIATEIGTTTQSLYQTCSRYKISLDPEAYSRGWAPRLLLRAGVRKKIETRAKYLNVTPTRLIEMLLNQVAEDDLFTAVLDLPIRGKQE